MIPCHGWQLHPEGVRWASCKISCKTSACTGFFRKPRQLYRFRSSVSKETPSVFAVFLVCMFLPIIKAGCTFLGESGHAFLPLVAAYKHGDGCQAIAARSTQVCIFADINGALGLSNGAWAQLAQFQCNLQGSIQQFRCRDDFRT